MRSLVVLSPPGAPLAGRDVEGFFIRAVLCHFFMTLSRALFLGLFTVGLAAPVWPCTTFDLVGGANIVFGRNFDYYAADGRVMVNRRGLKKDVFSTNSGLQWVSRFGSLTFNQFGHEFPNGGINEAGLVVEHMLLEGSQYPSDSRPSLTELQWIQYQLDCSASVADVLASDQRVRIQPGSTPLHFLVADRTGRCAVIEFLNGQLVSHTDSSLPVAALTNDTYDTSLAYAATISPGRADHVSSLGRFVQAAASVRNFTQSYVADPISYAFSALDNVNQPNWTRWSIVYDIANLSVYFRTLPVPLIKHIRLESLDFSPGAPIRMMDINTYAIGEVTPQAIYSAADNLAVLTSVYQQTTPLAYVSYSYIQRRAAYPDSVVPIAPPLIAAQPASQTVAPGGSAAFTVTATGDGTLTYQWRKDGVNLVDGGNVSGAGSPALSIAGARAGDAGSYSVVASNEAGSTPSNAAALTVFTPDQAFLQRLFLDVLGREIDPGALGAYSAAMSGGLSRAAVLDNLYGSSEYNLRQVEPAIRLYYAALARPPDYTGLQNWSNALQAGTLTLTGAAGQFAGSPEFVLRYGSLDNTGYVQQLYRNVLGREADSAGLADWVRQLAAGASRGQILVGFSESDEFKKNLADQVEILRLYFLVLQRMPTSAELQSWQGFLLGYDQTDTLFDRGYPSSLANPDYVQLVFRGFLRRDADAGTLSAFGNALTAGTISRASLVDTLLTSTEFSQLVGPVSRLYMAAFHRVPDAGGLDNWVNYVRAGNPLKSAADAFVASPEFQLTYGSLNDSQYVTLLYENVLGREPDPTGLATWTGNLG